MRILQIDAGREMRGGQWQVLRLMEGLRAAGAETWLAARADSPLFTQARERGLRVRRLELASLREEADLVHAHDAKSHALAVGLARAPVVVSRRVAFPMRTGLLSRWKYRQAAHFIAVSEFVRQVLVEYGIPVEKISVVYDGVPFLPPAQRCDSRILAPRPSADKPAELYGQTGLEISFAENLEDDLKTASLFVYISNSEGLGSGVLMAMAAGVPVIASTTGGIPEIIGHGDNGLLVDAAQPGAVAAAVRRLQGDPGFAGKLAARGRQTVMERFSIDIMVRNTLAVYRKVLAC
jgi:glycosyltransferase involved in cell wall biosynthesis